MKIYGMEKLSLVDYDGYVASTVFTGGCNFKCGFCHNSALVLDYNKIESMAESEVLEYLTKRKGIIEGLCITGGEPTLNPDLPEFIEKAKAVGVKVKLDTNGTNPEMVKYLCESGLVDYFAMDIKNDKNSYGEIISVPNFNTEKVEKTIEYFLSGKADYEFRTTLIKEYHKLENVLEIARWIKGAKKYCFQKFKAGENCIQADLTEVPLEQVKAFVTAVTPFVKEVKIRGYDL